ncbi:MAG: hypothetical protein J0L59_10440, partial [Xanthomonadales bacterium]|nr:hypothetical protein [Xanthomonadales bacterium]
SRVQGVLFTASAKLDMAVRGKEAFEDRRLRIPEARPELRADLHKLKKVTGPTGVPRFVADSDSAGHADRTWALFLALTAAADGAGAIEYTPAPRHPRGFDNSLDTTPGRTLQQFLQAPVQRPTRAQRLGGIEMRAEQGEVAAAGARCDRREVAAEQLGDVARAVHRERGVAGRLAIAQFQRDDAVEDRLGVGRHVESGLWKAALHSDYR